MSHRAKAVMVLGTTSGAGKSWLTTALCRYYARQGLRVAPFKAQNMSNNARVVTGGEIGSAQYFQALAAGARPEVRMNPLLLKPERDNHSQVVFMGQVDDTLTAMDWRARSVLVWPRIQSTLDDLLEAFDVVVIEGAGSPAEINLSSSDIVNMRVAEHAQAACLLVSDIDRGGSFAHLYGTWALLPEPQRALIQGFVLNRFRGDASLLAPGPQMLQDLTGVPTVGVLPMWREHGLPEEDGLVHAPAASTHPGPVLEVAVVAYPRISNHDEFEPLRHMPGVQLQWARSPADLADADWVILPGSKHTSSDLAWLRAQGLDAALAQHAAQGKPVLGICGGLQMLGEALVDPHGVDGNAAGLGLLPLVTVFEPHKAVQPSTLVFPHPMPSAQPWQRLSGLKATGYEIHHGQTTLHPGMPACTELSPGLAWQQGAVLGLYLHGLFEDPQVLRALFGEAALAVRTFDEVFDGLADFVQTHIGTSTLDGLISSPR